MVVPESTQVLCPSSALAMVHYVGITENDTKVTRSKRLWHERLGKRPADVTQGTQLTQRDLIVAISHHNRPVNSDGTAVCPWHVSSFT